MQTGVEDLRFLELLGPGDVLQPAITLAGEASTPTDVEWHVFRTTRAAILRREAIAQACVTPELIGTLMARLVLRSRRLGFQLAVSGLVRTEDRLRLVLWHFGDRWGRVTPDGILLDLPLTHQQLADVIRTKRPSMTTAARVLEEQGHLSRPAPHCWVLHGHPPELLRRCRERAASAG